MLCNRNLSFFLLVTSLSLFPGCDWGAKKGSQKAEPMAEQKMAHHGGAVREIESVEEFNKVLKDNELVVVDFYGGFCGPCKQIAPTVHEMAEKYGNKAAFIKLNSENSNLGSIFDKEGVNHLPTFGYYRKGKKVNISVGGGSFVVDVENFVAGRA